MARNTKSGTLIKGRRIRVTKLDSCGRWQRGDNSQLVSKGMITVSLKATTSTTDDINVQNAAGESIAFEAGADDLQGYAIEVVMGDVDPDLFTLMTGMPVVLDAFGNSVGFDIDTKVDVSADALALEVWIGVASDQACDDDGTNTFGYLLLPFLNDGILGDFTIENGAINMTLTGLNTKEGNGWGIGPYDVTLDDSGDPSPLLSPLSTSVALRLMFTGVPAPDALVGARPLLNPTDAPLTTITATVTAHSVAFVPTPDPPTGVGVEWNFGDGTWDYIESPGDVTHVYTDSGTYDVTATTNGVLVHHSTVIA